MNRVTVGAIVRKDVKTIIRNRGIRIPLMVVPLVILVLLPTLLVGTGELLTSSGAIPTDGGTENPLGSLVGTDDLVQSLAEVPVRARWAVFVLEVLLAPLYLMVPLITATVIAADSFAGERERKTLEALLHTPASDRELVVAKFLAALLPAVTVAWAGFAIYAIVANLLAWPAMGRVFFPSATWLLLAFWVAPAVSALGLSVMVVVSSRVRTLQAAHQIGSLVMLPILALLVAQIGGMLQFLPAGVLALGAGLWIGAALALRLGSASLGRSRLAERM
jgi:ABC-2 type transport system permease protein